MRVTCANTGILCNGGCSTILTFIVRWLSVSTHKIVIYTTVTTAIPCWRYIDSGCMPHCDFRNAPQFNPADKRVVALSDPVGTNASNLNVCTIKTFAILWSYSSAGRPPIRQWSARRDEISGLANCSYGSRSRRTGPINEVLQLLLLGGLTKATVSPMFFIARLDRSIFDPHAAG